MERQVDADAVRQIRTRQQTEEQANRERKEQISIVPRSYAEGITD